MHSIVFIALATSAPLFAQDDCSSPTVVSGEGSFPFDLTTATVSGFDGGATLCSTDAIEDVFFAWSPTQFGSYEIRACGADRNWIRAYLGGDCSAVCTAVGDPNIRCTGQASYESTLRLYDVSPSTTYLLQLSNFKWWQAPSIPETLTITSFTPPPNNTCSTASAIAGEGSFAYDNTWAWESAFVPSSSQCGSLTNPMQYDVFFVWTASAAGDYVLSAPANGGSNTFGMYVSAGTDCNAVCVDAAVVDMCYIAGLPDHRRGVSLMGVQAGDSYLVQIGSTDASVTGSAAPGDLLIESISSAPLNDSCLTATQISGTQSLAWAGVLPPSNSVDWQACPVFHPGIANLYFNWTATESGSFEFNTGAGGGGHWIHLLEGPDCTCTSLAIGERLLLEDVNAGDEVMVRIVLIGCPFDSGELNILPKVPEFNSNCSNPKTIFGTGVHAFDPIGSENYLFNGGDSSCNTNNSDDFDPPQNSMFYSWSTNCSGQYEMCMDFGQAGTISVHLGNDCSATCLAQQDPVACGAPFVFSAVAGEDYLIQIGATYSLLGPGSSSFPGTLEIGLASAPCPAPVLTIECDPANAHYLGGIATLSDSTVGTVAPSGLHLECTGGPVGEFGFFLVGPGANSPILVFQGILCLDAPNGRYSATVAANQSNASLNSIGQFDAAGVMQNLSGTSSIGSGFDVPYDLPFAPAGQVILPGESWSFQSWFRDQIAPLPNPGSSANFSDAVTVTFP